MNVILEEEIVFGKEDVEVDLEMDMLNKNKL